MEDAFVLLFLSLTLHGALSAPANYRNPNANRIHSWTLLVWIVFGGIVFVMLAAGGIAFWIHRCRKRQTKTMCERKRPTLDTISAQGMPDTAGTTATPPPANSAQQQEDDWEREKPIFVEKKTGKTLT